MTKNAKRELIKILNVLEEVNESMQKDASHFKKDDLHTVLTECQQGAITVGNRIEHIVGEGTHAVTLLEEYCELMYQIGEEVKERKNIRQKLKKVRNVLYAVKNSIEYELIDSKKEIVFLPYNASMWDSLESVWMAANEDPECQVYVVPIPYYDRKSDGTLGEMHYEGEKFPDYVPITSWEEYMVSEHYPDIIYIHNPYDGHNHVTTVHPSFYAKELRKYTDMLVYIPYFVCLDDKVPERFCVVPGTIYANKVIVRSQEERDAYIKGIRMYEQQNHCNGVFGDIEAKFLALGSPKLDKVYTVMQEKVEIPEPWKRAMIDRSSNDQGLYL